MTNDQMREAFEAWAKARSFNLHRSLIVAGDYSGTRTKAAWAAWQAGIAAGMERAAGICDGMRSVGAVSYETGTACANAIRAEIQGDRNA